MRRLLRTTILTNLLREERRQNELVTYGEEARLTDLLREEFTCGKPRDVVTESRKFDSHSHTCLGAWKLKVMSREVVRRK